MIISNKLRTFLTLENTRHSQIKVLQNGEEQNQHDRSQNKQATSPDHLEIETNTTQQVFGARQLAAFIDLNTYSRAGTEWPWASTKPLEQKRNVETASLNESVG